jgi:hypothetical protein
MDVAQRYAPLSAAHLAQWVQSLGGTVSKTTASCNERGGNETGEIVETLFRVGAPGWDRTSNPCLRRAVLYPLSYGRI